MSNDDRKQQPEASATQTESLPTTLEEAHREILQLRERLARLEETIAEMQANEDRLRRAAAHYDNLRKQAERALEEERKYGAERILKKLLPVKDDLERALEATASTENVAAIREGIEMVLRTFDEMLRSEGVTPIEAVGKPFDPMVHEAFAQHETDSAPPHHVLSEIRRGYLLNERLLRPAGVLVAVPPSQESQKSSESTSPDPAKPSPDADAK